MPKIHRAHKIRLDPTRVQAAHFARAAGTARFAYNWALAEWRAQYAAHLEDPTLPKPNEAALRRQLNGVKGESFPWMSEVTKCAPQQGVKDLGTAYKNFFKGTGKFPRFKRRGVSKDSFYLSNDQTKIKGKRLWVPKLGLVRMKEKIRWDDAKLLSCTISRTGSKWYASLAFELEIPTPPPHQGSRIGVDLGIKDRAITSEGTFYVNGKETSRAAARLRRLNKELARRVAGSNNRARTRAKLAQAHERVKNQRVDSLHKISHDLVKHHGFIGLEDLNISGMVRNRSLSKAISSASLGELVRQVEYKAETTGTKVVKVSRWFPSSKRCSTCGVENQDLRLSMRVWTCAACGANHDRDINAAINIRDEAIRLSFETLAGSSPVIACGEVGSGVGILDPETKPSSVKQEPNRVGNHA